MRILFGMTSIHAGTVRSPTSARATMKGVKLEPAPLVPR